MPHLLGCGVVPGGPRLLCAQLVLGAGGWHKRAVMAKYGVMMLEKLVLQYCPRGGSSAGMRTFMSTQLPALRQANPDLKVKLMEAHNRHPKAIGLYRNGQSKPVDVKNLDASQIEQHVSWLRSSHGRSQDYKVTSGRHLTRNPSIQGMWTVDTFAAQVQRRNEARLAAVVVSSAARE